MSKTNRKEKIFTHGGGQAVTITKEQELRRSVLATLLWEDQFYEDGTPIADRVRSLIREVSAEKVAALAVEAREAMKLRHMPLFIVREMARIPSHRPLVAETLARVIQRADELSEFVALYWKDKKEPLSAQVKKGLAEAFRKFDAYQLAKYDRDGAVKLRDVLFLIHAKPQDSAQEELWKKLVDRSLEPPDTWEVSLSAGKDRKETWERLLGEGKLGALALLRNLRNMASVGVDESIIRKSLASISAERVLPFRFLAAGRHAPQWEKDIEQAMFRSLEGMEKLKGKTVLIVDVSGSMYGSTISGKSDMDRAQVASALAVLIRELCENPVIYATAGNDRTRVHATKRVPDRRGFALSDAVYSLCQPLGGGGIFLKQVMDFVCKSEKSADRIIVITDEQDCSGTSDDAPARANAFGGMNYLINVASYKRGIGYGKWIHIDGWSDAVLSYMREYEKLQQ
jgi:hypothetical protein